MTECTVEKIMTQSLQYVNAADKVITVAKHMYQTEIGSVLVKKAGGTKGILTERDIVRHCIVGKKNIFNATVEEVMTNAIIAISNKKTVLEACNLMKEKGIKKLPVVNDKQDVVGILTMTDVVHNVDKLLSGGKANALFVRDMMAKHLFYSDCNDLVLDVAALMKRVNVGSIVVMKRGLPVGLLTERDIVKSCVIGKRNFALIKTEEIMSSPIISVGQNVPVIEAAHLMKQRKIKKLPVKNDANKIIGIITQTDIVYNMSVLIPKRKA